MRSFTITFVVSQVLKHSPGGFFANTQCPLVDLLPQKFHSKLTLEAKMFPKHGKEPDSLYAYLLHQLDTIIPFERLHRYTSGINELC